MRNLILTLFLVGVVTFVLTDPRWSGQLVTPISVSWQTFESTPGNYDGARAVYQGPEERCAFARRWLAEREARDEIVEKAELAAVERVMESCRTRTGAGPRDRSFSGSGRVTGSNFDL